MVRNMFTTTYAFPRTSLHATQTCRRACVAGPCSSRHARRGACVRQHHTRGSQHRSTTDSLSSRALFSMQYVSRSRSRCNTLRRTSCHHVGDIDITDGTGD
jgi:hypothetical protein